MIEYADLIGKPFEYYARGPEKFDCYGLLKELKRREGIIIRDQESHSDLDQIELMMSGALCHWKECERRPGAVVHFIIKGRKSHVGYLLTPRLFIHTWENSGGVLAEPYDISWKRRTAGFYDYAGTD